MEPLSGYLLLAQKLYIHGDEYAEGWNFGPNEKDIKSVEWILEKMISKWPNAAWESDQNSNPHEAGYLQLDINKAEVKLGWKPLWDLDYTLEKIINWQKEWLNNRDMQAVCLNEINEYTDELNIKD